MGLLSCTENQNDSAYHNFLSLGCFSTGPVTDVTLVISCPCYVQHSPRIPSLFGGSDRQGLFNSKISMKESQITHPELERPSYAASHGELPELKKKKMGFFTAAHVVSVLLGAAGCDTVLLHIGFPDIPRETETRCSLHEFEHFYMLGLHTYQAACSLTPYKDIFLSTGLVETLCPAFSIWWI